MKIKLVFIALNVLLLVAAVVQMLPIPPHADDVLGLYKSGYFKALDGKCDAAAAGFIAVKMYSAKPDFAWIFFRDLEDTAELKAAVYNKKGKVAVAPGNIGEESQEIAAIASEVNPQPVSEIRGGKYKRFIPMLKKQECGFCHKNGREGSLIGVLAFEQDYDAHLYYSRERVILFGLAAIVLGAALFFLIRWEPASDIKKMFGE